MSSATETRNTGFAAHPPVLFAEEAQALADRLQQLALAAAAAASLVPASDATDGRVGQLASAASTQDGGGTSDGVAPRNGPANGGTSTSEADARALEEQELVVQQLREEVSMWTKRRDEAAAEAATKESMAAAEYKAALAEEAEEAEAEAKAVAAEPELASRLEAELAACEAGEASARQRAEASEEVTARWRAEARMEEEESVCTIEALRKSLKDAESRAERARAEADMLLIESQDVHNGVQAPDVVSLEAMAAETLKVKEAGDAAETRASVLEEERARLRDELDSLRFRLKDTKKSQHKRAQELDLQFARLEKQRNKLESEYNTKMRTAEAEAAEKDKKLQESVGQLAKLQELNDRLTKQVQETQQERRAHEDASERLSAELREFEDSNHREEEEVEMGEIRLNEAVEADCRVQSELRTMKCRSDLIAKQVGELDKRRSVSEKELTEAEEVLEAAREEESSAARRVQILEWKLDVAATHLAKGSKSIGNKSAKSGARGSKDPASDSACGSHGESLP